MAAHKVSDADWLRVLDRLAPPPNPENYEHRLAGIRAHNRWLVDFCGRFPERRAGIGQIFLNDIDDAMEDIIVASNPRPISGEAEVVELLEKAY